MEEPLADDSKLNAFLQTLKDAVIKLETLDIVTAVGPLAWNDNKKTYDPVAGDAKVMRTTINLVVGDKSTWIDPAFVTGDLKTLYDLHQRAEAQGHEIVLKNIEALKALFDLVLHYRAQN